ncbi:MAG TPA: hypothetical protein VF073_04155 [Gaiella sp.]
MKTLMVCIATAVVMGMMSAAALAAQPPNPVPGPPVAYPCEATGGVAIWDDQFYPFDEPLCNEASENFFLCLAKFGQFTVQTPSAAEFGPDIVDMYMEAGASATQGKCPVFVALPRTYWLCYGAGANSLMALDQASAIKTLAAGARVPHASKTITTNTKVGDYYLTCDDQGQKITGRVVSTGNGGEVVSGAPSIGAGLLVTNPLDYTAEIG